MLYAYLISGLPAPRKITDEDRDRDYELSQEPSFICDNELFSTVLNRTIIECFFVRFNGDETIIIGIGPKEIDRMWEILEEESKGFLTEDIKDSELRIEKIQREVKQSPTQYAWYLCLREEVRLDEGLCFNCRQVCTREYVS